MTGFSKSNINFKTFDPQSAEYRYWDEADIRKAEKYDHLYFLERCISKALDVSLLDVQKIRHSPKAVNGIQFLILRDGSYSNRYRFEGVYAVENGVFKLNYQQIPLEDEVVEKPVSITADDLGKTA